MSDQHILELLLADIETAQQLLILLEQEFSALSERDLDALQVLLVKKQPALRTLEQHTAERGQLLLQSNTTADLQGLQQLAARSPLESQLLDSSAQLNSLIEQCQAANLRNGRLIRSNQTSVSSMLNIIRGTDTPSLYDKTGSAASTNKQRPFSQA
ncbi:flagellar protein FlgN [Pseudomonas sp. C27(2019)]|uniref:flagella synthesis protein FlgN n=1 Tax=Pseudomonas sp. C27(2019) TaxID=2604941 RepID=UPI001243EF3D|nr:flagellar protein FlgN [Pseudomonas sp. C27(2019)]QEY59279.1 flagellar protein FlgN [Pseudomonas sp. C27(2019)]